MTSRAAMPIAVLALAGCTWGEPPAVTVTAVSPVSTVRGAKAIVTLTGGGFAPDAVIDFDDPARSSVCGVLRVELRAPGAKPVPAPVALRDVWVLSPTVLRARLDGDAGNATWDVVLIDDAGREVTLPAALEVTHCAGEVNTACDDGEPCTFDATFGTAEDGIDKCTGNSSCGGASFRPDDDSCWFECAGGGTVPGTCQAGACVPSAGRCEPPPACSAP